MLIIISLFLRVYQARFMPKMKCFQNSFVKELYLIESEENLKWLFYLFSFMRLS